MAPPFPIWPGWRGCYYCGRSLASASATFRGGGRLDRSRRQEASRTQAPQPCAYVWCRCMMMRDRVRICQMRVLCACMYVLRWQIIQDAACCCSGLSEPSRRWRLNRIAAEAGCVVFARARQSQGHVPHFRPTWEISIDFTVRVPPLGGFGPPHTIGSTHSRYDKIDPERSNSASLRRPLCIRARISRGLGVCWSLLFFFVLLSFLS